MANCTVAFAWANQRVVGKRIHAGAATQAETVGLKDPHAEASLGTYLEESVVHHADIVRRRRCEPGPRSGQTAERRVGLKAGIGLRRLQELRLGSRIDQRRQTSL